MNDETEILALLKRWDIQQEGYIKEREERFGIMFEILEAAFGDGFSVIDAACGPGSLALRLLDRFPRAKVIAVDIDPVLLEIARVVLAPYGERASVVEADLSAPSWSATVMEGFAALGADTPSALVSTTALHWLSPGALAELYGATAEILQPGGIVLNGDHMRFDDRWPTLRSVAKMVRDRKEAEAVENGADDWAAWWASVAELPRFAALKPARDAFFASRAPKRKTSGDDCSVDFHVAALRHAGFSETGTAWQNFDNYVVFGRRPLE